MRKSTVDYNTAHERLKCVTRSLRRPRQWSVLLPYVGLERYRQGSAVNYILKWGTGSLSRWPPLPYSVDSRVIVKGMYWNAFGKRHEISIPSYRAGEWGNLWKSLVQESQYAGLDWRCASPEHKHRGYPPNNLARSFVQAAKLNNFVIITVYGLKWLDSQHQETSSDQSMRAKSGDSQPPIRRTLTILFAS